MHIVEFGQIAPGSEEGPLAAVLLVVPEALYDQLQVPHWYMITKVLLSGVLRCNLVRAVPFL